MYVYVYVYMYVCVYVCIYIYILARVGVHMHSCRCILFICTVLDWCCFYYFLRNSLVALLEALFARISLLHARVLQVVLNTCMRVCGGIGSGVCFILFMVSACYWRGRLFFGRGRDRGFVLYISLFLRVLGWCVCVCVFVYARTHTHKLLGYLM